MSRTFAIVKHVPKEELEREYRKEKRTRVKERLLAILHLYDGKTIIETSQIIKRGESSVKRWLRRWNKKGLQGLIPNFRGGPKPKLPSGEWDNVLKEIEGKGMTLKDVKVYVKTTRGVEYSYDSVWHILMGQRKVKYGKPFAQNAKRPPDAEAILKKDRGSPLAINPRR
ncbi:MAG: helix-turn-helix domain-containing protein [Nitrososphaerales archaeon]